MVRRLLHIGIVAILSVSTDALPVHTQDHVASSGKGKHVLNEPGLPSGSVQPPPQSTGSSSTSTIKEGNQSTGQAHHRHYFQPKPLADPLKTHYLASTRPQHPGESTALYEKRIRKAKGMFTWFQNMRENAVRGHPEEKHDEIWQDFIRHRRDEMNARQSQVYADKVAKKRKAEIEAEGKAKAKAKAKGVYIHEQVQNDNTGNRKQQVREAKDKGVAIDPNDKVEEARMRRAMNQRVKRKRQKIIKRLGQDPNNEELKREAVDLRVDPETRTILSKAGSNLMSTWTKKADVNHEMKEGTSSTVPAQLSDNEEQHTHKKARSPTTDKRKFVVPDLNAAYVSEHGSP